MDKRTWSLCVVVLLSIFLHASVAVSAGFTMDLGTLPRPCIFLYKGKNIYIIINKSK
jgi:hypothetical protein